MTTTTTDTRTDTTADTTADGAATAADADLDLDLDALAERLCRLAGDIAAATGAFVIALAEFDRRGGWAGDGILSCAHWLSWKCAMSLRTAREHVRIARALTHLPETTAAFAAGELSYSKARAITRVATGHTEHDLLRLARTSTAAALDRLTTGLRTAGIPTPDPDGSNSDDSNSDNSNSNSGDSSGDSSGDAAEGHDSDPADDPGPGTDGNDTDDAGPAGTGSGDTDPAGTGIGTGTGTPGPCRCAACVPGPDPARLRLEHHWDCHTGDLIIHGRFTAEEGATILAALRHAADSSDIPAGNHEPDDTSGDASTTDTGTASSDSDSSGAGSAAAADYRVRPAAPANARAALVAVATIAVAADAPAYTPLPEVTIIVDRHGTRVDGGTALDDTATDIALCSPTARRVDTADGAILAYGRTRRAPSRAQMRALHLRDGACRHPACTATRFLHAHHVTPWAAGGTTDLDNLITLCGRCHRALHAGAFTITAHGRQRFDFHTPSGDPIETAPALHGDAAAIADPDRDPQTITGTWAGEPLHLHYAVSVLADAWDHDRRRTRHSPAEAHHHAPDGSAGPRGDTAAAA